MKTSLTLALVSALAAIVIAYVFSVARQPADLLIVQAASASSPPARGVAWWALERLDDCPKTEFGPTTAVGFVIAGWNQSGNARFAQALELLIARGCDINGYDKRGLTPLHSAVLFNNAPAVRTLLRFGAKPELATAIAGRDGGRPINLEARAFAEYLDTVSGEDRSAIVNEFAAASTAAGRLDDP